MIRRIYGLAFFIIIMATTISSGQTLDGYKYVYVKDIVYKNGRSDIWGISKKLRGYFANKGFNVISDKTNLPQEVEDEPCLLLYCDVDHTEVTYGVNYVTIVLNNCKNETVLTNQGGGMGLSVQADFNNATKRAFDVILRMSYNFSSQKTPKFEYPEVEFFDETEETIRKYLAENRLNVIEGIYNSYQNDRMPFYKIGIIRKEDKFTAILIDSKLKHWKIGDVKAIFEESAMRGFYSVRWHLGDKTPYQTFANMENEAILSVELIDTSTGDKIYAKFIKMFPTGSYEGRSENNKVIATGSGFFLTRDGIIATNAHVVNNASKIEVTFLNGGITATCKANVIMIDEKNDVALLKVDDKDFSELTSIPYGIAQNIDIGSRVFTIGYPLNFIMGSNYKVTDGIISAASGINDDIRFYQITVPLQPGNSGGPLFNAEGNVVAITTSQLNAHAVGTKIENVNYAIKSSYLLALYNMLPNMPSLKPVTVIKSIELQDQVKTLKDYVCLIKIY
jgi:S1-C subfamily serine protease